MEKSRRKIEEMSMKLFHIKKVLMLLFGIPLVILSSCIKDNELNSTRELRKKLAGNWIVFQFEGSKVNDQYSSPYYTVTALDPNDDSTIIIDNLYNAGLRIKAKIVGDTGFTAVKTVQLDSAAKKNYNIDRITIDGYINQNFIIKDFMYQLASYTFENMSFTEDDMTEIIFYRAGFYNKNNERVDTVMIMGYRMTGFENVDY
jgi:hypothetical protein